MLSPAVSLVLPYARNAKSKTELAIEIEQGLIWRKQRKKWPVASLEFITWYKIMAAASPR